jgi:hypothetical protein
MRTLAALMLSMTLQTTALLLHAVAMNDQRPAGDPGSLADRAQVDHSRQLVVMRGR